MMKINPTAHVIAAIATLTVQGCSINPTITTGNSITDFTESINGRDYAFDTQGRILNAEMSGSLNDEGIPKGLAAALAPARTHCIKDGGVLFYEKHLIYKNARLPQSLVCTNSNTMRWALLVDYTNVKNTVEPSPIGGVFHYLRMKTASTLLTADQYAEKKRYDEVQSREAEKRRLAQIATAQRKADEKRDADIRRAEQRNIQVAEFQKNLKPGDRFQWNKGLQFGPGPYIGTVIRVQGSLAFVQFDNLTISNSQTRYIQKAELEPSDGLRPSVMTTIN